MADPRLSIGQHLTPAPAALPVCLPEVLHLFEACICVQTMSSNCKPVCHAFNPDTSFVTVSLASGVQCKEVVRNKESKCGSQQLQGPSPAHPRTLARFQRLRCRGRVPARWQGRAASHDTFHVVRCTLAGNNPSLGLAGVKETLHPPWFGPHGDIWGLCSPCEGMTLLARGKHGLGLPVNGSKACGLNRGLALYGLE